MTMSDSAQSRFINVEGFKIHYLEAGDLSAPNLILMHSCEYGSSASINWEFNVEGLARHFHVVAPDWLGYGQSEKIYDFGQGPAVIRRRILRSFLKTLAIEEADFIGNSCGAGIPLMWLMGAASPRDLLPIRKLIAISPPLGPYGPGRAAIGEYDGTRESMCGILKALFHKKWFYSDDDYVDRRQASGTIPGHWETLSAARFKMPGRPPSGFQAPSSYASFSLPVLFVTGRHDSLAGDRDGGIEHARDVTQAEFAVFQHSGHCAHMEEPEDFNKLAIEFLTA